MTTTGITKHVRQVVFRVDLEQELHQGPAARAVRVLHALHPVGPAEQLLSTERVPSVANFFGGGIREVSLSKLFPARVIVDRVPTDDPLGRKGSMRRSGLNDGVTHRQYAQKRALRERIV